MLQVFKVTHTQRKKEREHMLKTINHTCHIVNCQLNILSVSLHNLSQSVIKNEFISIYLLRHQPGDNLLPLNSTGTTVDTVNFIAQKKISE